MALIGPLAWEPPYAMGAGLQKKSQKKWGKKYTGAGGGEWKQGRRVEETAKRPKLSESESLVCRRGQWALLRGRETQCKWHLIQLIRRQGSEATNQPAGPEMILEWGDWL